MLIEGPQAYQATGGNLLQSGISSTLGKFTHFCVSLKPKISLEKPLNYKLEVMVILKFSEQSVNHLDQVPDLPENDDNSEVSTVTTVSSVISTVSVSKNGTTNQTDSVKKNGNISDSQPKSGSDNGKLIANQTSSSPPVSNVTKSALPDNKDSGNGTMAPTQQPETQSPTPEPSTLKPPTQKPSTVQQENTTKIVLPVNNTKSLTPDMNDSKDQTVAPNSTTTSKPTTLKPTTQEPTTPKPTTPAPEPKSTSSQLASTTINTVIKDDNQDIHIGNDDGKEGEDREDNKEEVQKEGRDDDFDNGKGNMKDIPNRLGGGDKKVQDYSYEEESSGAGHFMAYFLTAVVLCVAGYVIFHNKQKIVAFIVEGRNGRQSSRRPNKSGYKKLTPSGDDVLPKLEKSTSSSQYIY
ncbi:hypothetical protein FSP39_008297 [Pinctada imbricata]|uniref:Trans-Golgi network integral membrane protein 2 n=1 Tax=Pinctada imbricata TaxID=66713 RepID=A0AA88XQW2_PINIB|nr:hypothetical protein FSP39_008297 [Pinctada imbricata]